MIPVEAFGVTAKPSPKASPKRLPKPTPTPTKKKFPSPTPTPKPISPKSTPSELQDLPVLVEGAEIKLSSLTAPISMYGVVRKNGRDFPLLIAKPREGTIRIFSARCPHQGNILNLAIRNEFTCDLHGARFDSTTGKVLDGPTISNLEIYDPLERNGILYIRI